MCVARNPPPFEIADFHAVDLADADATAAALGRITARHQVDNLVNNAGLVSTARLEALALSDLDAAIAVNVRAAMQCAQACPRGQNSVVVGPAPVLSWLSVPVQDSRNLGHKASYITIILEVFADSPS